MKTDEILTKVKDEGISALSLTIGVAAGVGIIRFAKNYVPNQWLLPLSAFGAGFVGKAFLKNATLKDISTGVMVVGVADIAKKGIDWTISKVPALAPLAQVSNALPQLSGPEMYPIVPAQLRGDFAPANVVSSTASLR